MSESEGLKNVWDAGLANKEYCIIGTIVAQWGALEAEVFDQTLITFGSDIHVNQLPREMNNLNFTSVLKLWKERVVDTSEAKVKSLLEKTYKKILELKDFRNSIIHGMWEFSLGEPKTISTFRVKKDQLIHTVFKDGSLANFSMEVAQLNADIRYPGGLAEFFQDQMSDGFYVNKAEMRRMILDSDKEGVKKSL